MLEFDSFLGIKYVSLYLYFTHTDLESETQSESVFLFSKDIKSFKKQSHSISKDCHFYIILYGSSEGRMQIELVSGIQMNIRRKKIEDNIKKLITIMGMSSIMFLYSYVGNIRNGYRFHALIKTFLWLASPWQLPSHDGMGVGETIQS